MQKTKHSNPPETTSITPAALTEGQAAEYIGMSFHFLRQARHHGNHGAPTYVKIGRSVRYLLADLDSWLQGNRVESGGSHAWK